MANEALLIYGVSLSPQEQSTLLNHPLARKWGICANDWNPEPNSEYYLLGAIIGNSTYGEANKVNVSKPAIEVELIHDLYELGIDRKPSWFLVNRIF
ncbi:MAG: hypothetical protein NC548_22780 [Lachnospiraceae bacterium]|nr:hypothetical protein [Lachnospiraceae bacterium]